MQNPQGGPPEIDALEAAAVRAAQIGQEDEADRLWKRILEIDPSHARTLTALGQQIEHEAWNESDELRASTSGVRSSLRPSGRWSPCLRQASRRSLAALAGSSRNVRKHEIGIGCRRDSTCQPRTAT